MTIKILPGSKGILSIKKINGIDLPAFTVLTGRNGSGKTQLLSGIKNGNVIIDGVTTEKILLFTKDDFFLPKQSKVAMGSSYDFPAEDREPDTVIIDEFRNLQTEFLERRRNDMGDLTRSVKHKKSDKDTEIRILAKDKSLFFLTKDDFKGNDDLHDYYIREFHTPFWNQMNHPSRIFYKVARDEYNKPVTDISREELARIRFLLRSKAFELNLSRIFSDYLQSKSRNIYKLFLNEKYGHSLPVLQDDNFPAPPWDVINRLIKNFGLCEVTFPKDTDTGLPPAEFIVQAFNRTTGEEYALDTLSSGEKIMMALVVSLYGRDNYSRPQILLLDEIDASLHPSMIRNVLDAIQRTFVTEMGCTVIMTTHSPSTVALAPEESLYVLVRPDSKDAPHEIKKIDRADALNTLCEGILTVSPMTVFVLVEDRNDELFYTSVYSHLHRLGKLPPEAKLVFRNAGKEKAGQRDGGCEEVAKWAKKFERNPLGLPVVGLVDRDQNKDESPPGVFKPFDRYALENYLFDPLLVLLAFRDTLSGKDGIPEYDEETLIEHYSAGNAGYLQPLADSLYAALKGLVGFPPAESMKETRPVQYTSGLTLDLPYYFTNNKIKDFVTGGVLWRYLGVTSGCVMDRLLDAAEAHPIVPEDLLEGLQGVWEKGAKSPQALRP